MLNSGGKIKKTETWKKLAVIKLHKKVILPSVQTTGESRYKCRRKLCHDTTLRENQACFRPENVLITYFNCLRSSKSTLNSRLQSK